jgi:hypothetical protein
VGGACSANGRKDGCVYVMVGKPEEKRPLGRTRSRWVDNIKMDLVEMRWLGLDSCGSRY